MGDTDIAIVGIGCRLPGAQNPDEYWRLLEQARSARVEFTTEQMRAAGASEQRLRDPHYVKAGMVLADIDRFDAGFFGFSPRDAAIMDPQHRVFLEVCWEALEDAALVPEQTDGRIGVFAGCGMDTYLLHNVLTNRDLVRDVGMFLIRHTGNDKDFLATRVSYQFDLRGPSVNVLTACSTSLVAVHQAAQSLLSGECDVALAGGVTILVPQEKGYRYEPGEILSPDANCRAFDKDSKGTIFGSGAGVVVLRRLQDALAAGDHIHAVIAGSAVNNDGARKVGYLAPSVDGYAEVVAEALAMAEVGADEVQYVEAHGTGTPVGDPIEIEALTQAFRATTMAVQSCGIGSVKTNIGHLDTAAGIAGLLKVVLAMQHGRLPASLHFRAPNPLIDFAKSPFRVVAAAEDWPQPATGPRTAGVSSLGVGGTNAHVVVRQAPAAQLAEEPYARRYHLLPLAGKHVDAVTGAARRLEPFVKEQDDELLPRIAATLQTGRKAFAQRAFVVGETAAELARELAAIDASKVRRAPERPGSVVFLFPGGGAQYPGMGRGLYEHEPVYRQAADECLAALPAERAAAVRALLFLDHAAPEFGDELERPSLALPALFVTEYALARTLQSLGVEPEAMLGHSMGEYVAACLAGVFSPADGMRIVLLRGELFEAVEPSAMLSVPLPAAEVLGENDRELSLAAANAPQLSAVGGTVEAIESLQQRLQARGVECQRLRIQIAAHSHLLDPILDRFRQGLRTVALRPAERPFVSNVTGDWIEPAMAADVEYWVRHLRQTVRFQDGVATLLAGGDRVFVEVGPGKALTSLVRLHQQAARSAATTSMPHPQEATPADRTLLECLGRLFQSGVTPDWRALHGGARRKVRLPTYAFVRQRYWLDAPNSATSGGDGEASDAPPARLPESEWLTTPKWTPVELAADVVAVDGARWLVVGNGAGLGAAVANEVKARGGSVVVVAADGDAAAIARAYAEACKGGAPTRVLFLAAIDGGDARSSCTALLHLQQAIAGSGNDGSTRWLAVTSGALAIDGAPTAPQQAAVHGFLGVVPTEYPGCNARALDVDATSLAPPALATLAAHLRREIEANGSLVAIGWRRGQRSERSLVAAAASATPSANVAQLRQRGVYLITGGLGGIASVLARDLAQRCAARLCLVSRSGLPPREVWDEWLQRRPGDRIAQQIARVRELEALGAECLVVAADVADHKAMVDVVARVRSRFGALHGVFHAAGVLDDGPLQLRTGAQIAAMLAPKVQGAIALDQALQSSPPELMVLFASTSGLHGIPGQCDYAAANAVLDAFAAWRSAARPGRTLAVDWGIWQQVGMVAGASEPLRADAAVPAHPYLGERTVRGDGVEFARTWSARHDWPLAEHRLRDGRAVLPGTGHLELCLLAARAASGHGGALTLQRVELRAPLQFLGDEMRRVYVAVTEQGGGLHVAVESASQDGRERTLHAEAQVERGGDAGALQHLDAWWDAARQAAPSRGAQAEFVQFGPRWESQQASGYRAGGAVVSLQLPVEFTADLRVHAMHPALLDAAILAVVPLLPGADRDTLYAPVGCAAVHCSAALPATVVVNATVRDVDTHGRLATVDLLFASATGVPLVHVVGLQLLGLQGGFAQQNATIAKGAAVPAPARTARPAAVPRVAALLGNGIEPSTGIAAMLRAIAATAPQIAISSMPTAEVASWLAVPTATRRDRTFAAVQEPAATGTGSEPRDDVERLLATVYRELLGVDRVQLDQDFFELGGHSLLAVRLFARIHKEYGIDLQLATLLGAPSVRLLAAVLRQHLRLPEPNTAVAQPDAMPQPAPVPPMGEHLVPIQPRGDRPILFLVHGAGGNVLGFRDLAHYLGPDQPVYGLQARGVDGKQAPHERIEDMARDYLAELRKAQPSGPYYLGGYSGGGCVAFEIAQQLRAVGEQVAFVGMIDTPTPHMKERSLLQRGAIHVRRLVERGPLYPLRMVAHKLQQRRTRRQHEELAARGEVMPQELRGAQMQHAFDTAFFRYQCRPYDGRVWLFRAESESRTRFVRDRTLGWEPFPRLGVVSIDCPGDHFSMCAEPHIRTLCQRLRAAMDEAIAATAPATART